jgi:hypothetical protein
MPRSRINAAIDAILESARSMSTTTTGVPSDATSSSSSNPRVIGDLLVRGKIRPGALGREGVARSGREGVGDQ